MEKKSGSTKRKQPSSKTAEKCYRDSDLKYKLKRRLLTVEGQLRGINKMLDENQNSIPIMIQLLASTKSIKSVANELIRVHFDSLVSEDIKKNKQEEVDMLLNLLKKLD